MKEFEDLWEEGGGGICGKRDCEKFWRAALEEVLRQVETSNSDGSIIDWIKKELKS